MAVHYLEATIDFPETAEEQFDSFADRRAPTDDMNLGAFRGLGYALVLETILVTLGGLGWGLWHILR